MSGPRAFAPLAVLGTVGIRLRGTAVRAGRGIRLSDVWVSLAVALPMVACLIARLPSGDLAYHIRAGELMLERREILRTDPFTFSMAGQRWIDQQWVAQIALALAFRAGGWPAMVVLRAILLGALLLILLRQCRRWGASRRLSAAIVLGAFLVVAATPGTLALRPQLLAALLFVALNGILWDRGQRPGGLLWVPLLSLAWSNLHGTFPLVLILCSFALLEDALAGGRVGPLGAVTIAALASTLIGPFGADVWSYVRQVTGNPVVQDLVGEWKSPSLTAPGGIAFAASAAALGGAMLRSRRRPPLWVMLELAFFAALSVRDQRSILWWALAGAPAAAFLARHLAPDTVEPRRRLNLALAATVGIASVAALPWWRDPGLEPARSPLVEAPLGVTAAVSRTVAPGERLFTSHLWASWFELAVPGRPLLVDSRIEFFPPRIWRDYLDVTFAASDWRSILARWRVRVVAASWEQQYALIPRLRNDPGWIEAYADRDGVVFLRSPSAEPVDGTRSGTLDRPSGGRVASRDRRID